MFIAHLPAGYLTAQLLADRTTNRPPPSKLWWAAALIGSVLPDVDVLYFYLVDHRATLHHQYFTHLPAFWLALLLVGAWHPVSRILLTNVFCHLLLDTIAGGVLWLWPFGHTSVVLVTVPARYNWWVWNFVFHWSFLFEMVLCGAAAYCGFRRVRKHHGCGIGR